MEASVVTVVVAAEGTEGDDDDDEGNDDGAAATPPALSPSSNSSNSSNRSSVAAFASNATDPILYFDRQPAPVDMLYFFLELRTTLKISIYIYSICFLAYWCPIACRAMYFRLSGAKKATRGSLSTIFRAAV